MWYDRLVIPGDPRGPTTTIWQFTPAIYAYGGYWNLAEPGSAGTGIAVSIDSASIGEIPNTYSGQFWGFVSTEPFSNVFLRSGTAYGWCETYEMDNMVYAFTGGLELTKIDDVNDGDCVVPDQEINYTISYDFTGAGDTNVLLIDYLPVGVDYNSSTPPGDYNTVDRTVIWDIGTVPTDGNGTFTLKCLVNYDAEPCSIMTNFCEIEGDSTQESAEVNTPVCFWNQIIYVDHNAAGLNNGLSWQDAYLDLQDALERAAIEDNSEIWVARGTYNPSALDPYGYKTFNLIDGVPVYGHFADNETSRGQRDLNDPNNETILSGAGLSVRNVVTATGLSKNTVLDGLTIMRASAFPSSGVKIENACLTISNCIISNNGSYGIYSINSDFTAADCTIKYNSAPGIYANSSDFTVADCIIQNNNYGIYEFNSSSSVIAGCKIFAHFVHGIELLSNSSALIIDNLIYRNVEVGINLSTTGTKTIRNNTIVGNNYGINLNSGTAPVIANCIIWGNNDDLRYCSATYSCIEDNDAGTGNIHSDPCFVEADINDFHLSKDSNCIDAGDPNFADFNEIDIDGQCRIMFGKTTARVDIGADELYWLKSDFDRNEIVNFNDYAIWSPAWQTIDPNKTLDTDEDVDIDDLDLFSDYWLREGPWEYTD